MLKDISKSIKDDSKEEPFYFCFGIRVKNMLRKGGFNWNDSVLDQLWLNLVKKIIHKKCN